MPSAPTQTGAKPGNSLENCPWLGDLKITQMELFPTVELTKATIQSVLSMRWDVPTAGTALALLTMFPDIDPQNVKDITPEALEELLRRKAMFTEIMHETLYSAATLSELVAGVQ